jgi:hypothetical protein
VQRLAGGYRSLRRSSTGTERDLVRVATFNINNINKRLDNLLAWLAKAEPDVVSLQDTVSYYVQAVDMCSEVA